MAWSDMLTLAAIFGIGLLLSVLVTDFIVQTVMGAMSDKIPASLNTSINNSWDNNVAIYNNSYPVIFFLFGAVIIGLTVFLNSHPIFILAWIFFQMILLWIFDALRQALVPILASPLNTGAMSVAASFVMDDLAPALIILNILLGIVFLGKNLWSNQ